MITLNCFLAVGNEILRTFDSHKTLLAMYFQSMSSYELDIGTPLIKCPPLTSENLDLISQVKEAYIKLTKVC